MAKLVAAETINAVPKVTAEPTEKPEAITNGKTTSIDDIVGIYDYVSITQDSMIAVPATPKDDEYVEEYKEFVATTVFDIDHSLEIKKIDDNTGEMIHNQSVVLEGQIFSENRIFAFTYTDGRIITEAYYKDDRSYGWGVISNTIITLNANFYTDSNGDKRVQLNGTIEENMDQYGTEGNTERIFMKVYATAIMEVSMPLK